MKATVTDTSTDLFELLETAWYNAEAISNNAIKWTWWNNFWIYIEVPVWGNSVYLDNFVPAISTTWKEIAAGESFTLDVRNISNLNLITATTQEIRVIIV